MCHRVTLPCWDTREGTTSPTVKCFDSTHRKNWVTEMSLDVFVAAVAPAVNGRKFVHRKRSDSKVLLSLVRRKRMSYV